MNLLQTVCGSEVSFYKELSDFIYKTWKKDKKRGKSCLISFCNCTKSDLFLTVLASVVSPRVTLRARTRRCCQRLPLRRRPFALPARARARPEIGSEPLGSLQKDSGTRAEPLLFLKAKLSGCCEGAVAPAWETPLRGRERGQLVRAAAATGWRLSGEALCWWSRDTRESRPSLGETDGTLELIQRAALVWLLPLV